MKIDILAVCTGNVCRSPAIERLLAARTGLRVRSAGTHAVVGAPVSAPMAALMSDGGIATEGFAARQLSGELVRSARLVLTATDEHRTAVLALDPDAVGRTFTLRELVRLAAHLPAARTERVRAATSPRARLHELAAAAHGLRTESTLPPRLRGADDIADPIGRPPAVYAETYTQINAAVASLARLLG